ncbi:MAG: hypothetical protein K2X08_01620 [Chlamydiales bacterium]|nr:hypothetical protein [Chlamydiales bacterium]
MTTLNQTGLAVRKSYWEGALFVSGVCIGGGMLAMPLQTANAGFLISGFILFISWMFMTFTGCLLVEVTLWFKHQAHFPSMAQSLLGNTGKTISLIIYLFMNCASLVAYVSGSALLLNNWVSGFTGVSIGYKTCCLLFTLVFGVVVSFGASLISKINYLFMILMGIVYFYLVFAGSSFLQIENLSYRSAWLDGLGCFPIIFAAFSYQMIVPSLCSYLDYNVEKLRKSIVLGTAFPFIIYFVWLLIIHGIIPFEGARGLKETLLNGNLIVDPLKVHFTGNFFFLMIDGFAFIALVTSYLGLSLALFDFIHDLCRKKEIYTKNKITLFSLIPSLILAMFFPRALLEFLDLSGGFGDAILSGLIPVAMIWVGRYRKKYINEYTTFGGKPLLCIAGSFAFFIFIVQWIKLFGVLA